MTLAEPNPDIVSELIQLFLKRQQFTIDFLKDHFKEPISQATGLKHGGIGNIDSWQYFFHGHGVRLTNKDTKEEIEFDFMHKEPVGGLEAHWISKFIRKEVERKALDKDKYYNYAHKEFWDNILEGLKKQGKIKKVDNSSYRFMLSQPPPSTL